MKRIEMLKLPVFGERALLLCVLFSVIWHLFWMSAIAVVVTPKEIGAIKFSKVSFLGPISQKNVLEIRMDPGQRSLLEKRYLRSAEDRVFDMVTPPKLLAVSDIPDKDHYPVSDNEIAEAVKDALMAPKNEPRYDME